MLFDSHVHCHEFPAEELRRYRGEFGLVCVSDDLRSSEATASMEGVVRCLGIHPWRVGRAEPGELEGVLRLIERAEAQCIGEVGLDRRFVPDTIDRQREFFRAFLAEARELALPVNVHAPDAWGEALEMLRRADVDRALIHWYTGPLHLLEEIRRYGYFISINPAASIQPKHREVAKAADRRIVVVESDGPYEYRGMRLAPPEIKRTVGLLAELWGLPREEVEGILAENSARLWR